MSCGMGAEKLAYSDGTSERTRVLLVRSRPDREEVTRTAEARTIGPDHGRPHPGPVFESA